jgi:hypothetical protein
MGARYVWINVVVGRLFAVAGDAEQRLISVSTSLTSAAELGSAPSDYLLRCFMNIRIT